MAALQEIERRLNEEFDAVPLLQLIKTKANNPNVTTGRLAVGFVAILFIFVLFGFWPNFFCNLLGFVYPTFASIRAIESRGKDDDTQWLTYWVVFGLFSLIDYLISSIFGWWFVVKFLVIIWLLSPTTRGAEFLYAKAIKPIAPKLSAKTTQVEKSVSAEAHLD